MCDQWWDERLLREEVEKLKRSATPPAAPAPQPEKETPQRKPENQPDPVPV